MPQRLALVVATVAATIVLTIGLVVAGFAPVPGSGGIQSAAVALDGDLATDGRADPELTNEAPLEPEVVYVKPAPTPQTIVLKKQAPAAKAASSGSRTTVVRRVPSQGDDEHDEGREHALEDAAERREHAAEQKAERAKEQRENEREDDD